MEFFVLAKYETFIKKFDCFSAPYAIKAPRSEEI